MVFSTLLLSNPTWSGISNSLPGRIGVWRILHIQRGRSCHRVLASSTRSSYRPCGCLSTCFRPLSFLCVCPPTMEGPAPDWSDLPADILISILQLLECPDLLRFTAVYTVWQNAYSTVRHGNPVCPRCVLWYPQINMSHLFSSIQRSKWFHTGIKNTTSTNHESSYVSHQGDARRARRQKDFRYWAGPFVEYFFFCFFFLSFLFSLFSVFFSFIFFSVLFVWFISNLFMIFKKNQFWKFVQI